jgi:hypothetical protein
VIEGKSFTGASSVRIGGTSTRFVVNSAGRITAIVPAAATGRVAVTVGGITSTSGTPLTVTPGATVSPTAAHPGQSITVSGAGFTASSSFDVYFDTTDVALAVSNASGVVTATIVVPTSASPTQHWITLNQRSNDMAAATSLSVTTTWAQTGFASDGSNFNPFENTINSSNASQLRAQWIFQAPNTVPGPIVENSGMVFYGDNTSTIRAIASTGQLVWTASPATSGFGAISPVFIDGLVVFGAPNNNHVFAYKAACGSHGAACTPAWTAALPANVSASLTIFGGQIIVPASNGNIYPLNPANGAVGTPFFAANDTSGAVTTPVVFDAGGLFLYGDTNGYQETAPSGTTISATASGVLGGLWFGDDSILVQSGGAAGGPDGTTYGGASCLSNLATAYGYLYASCGGLAAYSLYSSAAIWSFGSSASALTVANGVVYACSNGTVVALDAMTGGLLFTGGFCNGTPIVVNGTLYVPERGVAAYSINGQVPAMVRARPRASQLKPDARLPAVRTPDFVTGD